MAVNASATAKLLAELKPDIAFVSGWYWLLNEETLSLVPHGLYGVHNSILPRYRGGAPLVWMIIRGEKEVGATVFRFTPGMDDGDVLHTVRVPLAENDTIADALERIRVGLIEQLPPVWADLVAGRASLTPQDHSVATYCGLRKPQDGLIDWRQPARRVHDFVRAQVPPYPGAFTKSEGREVTLLRTAVEDRIYYGTPGQVLERSPHGVLVSCGGSTALLVKQAAIEGDPIQPSAAFPSINRRLA